MFIMVLLFGIGFAAVFVQGCGKNEGGKRSSFYYLALGDSIPNGYSVTEEEDMEGYPRILAEKLKDMKESTVSLSEYTKDGITAGGLYEKYLSDAKVQEELKRADLITVTAGANDILKRFRALYREVFGEDAEVRDMETVFSLIQREAVKKPELAVKAAGIIKEWEWDGLEKDWKKLMESIQENQKESCRVIVTTLYNPVDEKADLGILNLYIEKQIACVNDIIVQYSETYGYQVAELREAGVEKHLQPDGLHPDRDGQKMIAERVRLLLTEEL